jgi:hypothetical protein
MTNWRSSVTATLGINVKLNTTSSLQNLTTSHTTHAYTGERERERKHRTHKERRWCIESKNSREEMRVKANMVMQWSLHL